VGETETVCEGILNETFGGIEEIIEIIVLKAKFKAPLSI
jgi:hypothetical protein